MCMNGVSNCCNCPCRIECETLRNTKEILAILHEQQLTINATILGLGDLSDKFNTISEIAKNKNIVETITNENDDEEEFKNTIPMKIPSRHITVIDTKGVPIKKTIRQKISEVLE